jgi:hypothetical protein
MVTATSTTMCEAVRWARPAVAELVATIAALQTTERLIECGCGATWHGHTGDPCRWCEEATQRHLDDQRQQLLHPNWMTDQGPVYDQLSDVDKAVWDHTRGQAGTHDSIPSWTVRLKRAVETGLITDTEADLAMTRVERWLET